MKKFNIPETIHLSVEKEENRLIETREELEENMAVLDGYLSSRQEETVSFAKELLKRGKCFVAAKKAQGFRFYPSKFIGYAKNSKESWENNNFDRDGRETNKALSKLLNDPSKSSEPPTADAEMEQEYLMYCRNLGIEATRNNRKYWRIYI